MPEYSNPYSMLWTTLKLLDVVVGFLQLGNLFPTKMICSMWSKCRNESPSCKVQCTMLDEKILSHAGLCLYITLLRYLTYMIDFSNMVGNLLKDKVIDETNIFVLKEDKKLGRMVVVAGLCEILVISYQGIKVLGETAEGPRLSVFCVLNPLFWVTNCVISVQIPCFVLTLHILLFCDFSLKNPLFWVIFACFVFKSLVLSFLCIYGHWCELSLS